MRASRTPTTRGTLAFLAASLVILQAGRAEAAPYELEWSAPEGCPTRERMMEASRRALGEPMSSGAAELVVHGEVTSDEGSFLVVLRVRDAAGADLGERRVRFYESRCSEIEEPAALLVAMMIAVARSREPARETAAEPAPPPAPPPAPSVVAPPLRDRTVSPSPVPEGHKEPLAMAVSGSGVASLGFLPNVGLGVALRWTASFPMLVLGAEGSFETSWATSAPGGDVTFRYFDAGALVGLRVLRSRAFELIPLVEARLGALAGSTSGFRASYDTTRLVGIVAAGALVKIRLGSRTHLEILPDVRLPLAHDVFDVRQDGQLIRLHETASVEARLSIGVGWSF
ncbi:hypothetical protein AKJ09_04841 [Labilithrix luteola]|uniref:Outer membrane protein beta-barrel domain-containing protein n=1 Tax=Labilithrix luteola TaxID=1391654 RepID=A0A0K1PXD4_9BACT|nr:hypothetical protein [Labilithrix luteola]AKU98177.1 hypothetical protein AKJ09_04841 [Labilithrix luteola]